MLRGLDMIGIELVAEDRVSCDFGFSWSSLVVT